MVDAEPFKNVRSLSASTVSNFPLKMTNFRLGSYKIKAKTFRSINIDHPSVNPYPFIEHRFGQLTREMKTNGDGVAHMSMVFGA